MVYLLITFLFNTGIFAFKIFSKKTANLNSHFKILYYSLNGIFPWETTHRRQSHMKLSSMGKCSIKHTDLFNVIIGTMINFMTDLTSQWKSIQSTASFAFNPVEFYRRNLR